MTSTQKIQEQSKFDELWWVMKQGDIGAIRAHLATGVSLEREYHSREYGDMRILDLAAIHGKADIMIYLLQHGANLNTGGSKYISYFPLLKYISHYLEDDEESREIISDIIRSSKDYSEELLLDMRKVDTILYEDEAVVLKNICNEMRKEFS